MAIHPPCTLLVSTGIQADSPVILTPIIANTTGIGWEAAMVKAKAFVAQLTPEEKDDMVVSSETFVQYAI
jgi:hypothetical protein